MSLTNEQITSVKARGFLRNRGTDCFSGRVVSAGGIYTAEDLHAIAECAKNFGNGQIAYTSRLSAEIVGIPFEKIPEAEEFLRARGLEFGGTGAKVRPIAACKGTTCIFGNIDTQALAKTLHDRFYIGMADVSLPHKFKIGVGGCFHSCMKPSLNDVGIEGRRVAGESVCIVFVGGTWGKTQRMGTQLSRTVKVEDVPDLVEKIMLWYRENGLKKERLGKTVDRLGVDALEASIFSDDLFNRRDSILSAPLKEVE